jgi:hypothetical protein
MRFGTWNVRNLYRAGSFTAAARKLARCNLNIVCVQEVMWDKEGTVIAGVYTFFYVKVNEIINWEQVFFTPQNSISS